MAGILSLGSDDDGSPLGQVDIYQVLRTDVFKISIKFRLYDYKTAIATISKGDSFFGSKKNYSYTEFREIFSFKFDIDSSLWFSRYINFPENIILIGNKLYFNSKKVYGESKKLHGLYAVNGRSFSAFSELKENSSIVHSCVLTMHDHVKEDCVYVNCILDGVVIEKSCEFFNCKIKNSEIRSDGHFTKCEIQESTIFNSMFSPIESMIIDCNFNGCKIKAFYETNFVKCKSDSCDVEIYYDCGRAEISGVSKNKLSAFFFVDFKEVKQNTEKDFLLKLIEKKVEDGLDILDEKLKQVTINVKTSILEESRFSRFFPRTDIDISVYVNTIFRVYLEVTQSGEEALDQEVKIDTFSIVAVRKM